MSLAILFLCAGLGLGLLGLGPKLAARRRLAARARRLAARHADSREAARPRLRRAGETRLDALAQRLVPRPAVLRTRLAATGRPITLAHYVIASAAAAALGGAAALALGAAPGLALLSAAADGLFLPHAAVGLLIARRRGRFLKLFAEAVALIVRGIRAGLPVTETIAVVGQEIAEPVGGEFRAVADQIRLGGGIEQAMGQAARRIGLPEFDFLVISLAVQRETGGNLAETLENLERILRRRQQMRLKVKAMSSEAAASALIIGALPFVMGALMSVVSPDYLRVLFTTPVGRLLLGGAAASLVTGGLVMQQMVRFEI